MRQPPADDKPFAARFEALIADRDPTGQASRAFDQIKEDVEAIRAGSRAAGKPELRVMAAEFRRLAAAGDVNAEAAKAFVRRILSGAARIRRPAPAEQELMLEAYAQTAAEAQGRSEPLPLGAADLEFFRQVAQAMKDRGELD